MRVPGQATLRDMESGSELKTKWKKVQTVTKVKNPEIAT